ncbi:MAG TPA: hypothetical protein VGE38_06935 [Nocardioides sp.]|uniref:hypothetical protein n=1 Tax=Nocardioides sp. TaxID=35761 RepID=UPI002ED94A56
MRITFITVAATVALLGACSAQPSEPDKYGAQDVCKQFVEKRLKAPSTADYQNTTTTQDANQWTVEGDVDAENSFGAKIRNHYVCVVKPRDSEGTNWELVDIQMGEG